MAEYPEKFLLKLPAGTFARIGAVSSNRSEFVRAAIEAALGAGPEKKNSIVARAPSDILEDLPMKPAPDGPHKVDVRTPLPSLSPRDRDKALLLSLIRGKSLTSRSARDAMGLPGLRYDNAEKALLTDGVIAVHDGILVAL